MPGILEVAGNPIVGSLLIRFSDQLITEEKILSALREGGATSPESDQTFPNRNSAGTGFQRLVQSGMKLALGLSMGSLLIGYRRIHIQAGLVFLGLVSLHVAKKSGRNRPREE